MRLRDEMPQNCDEAETQVRHRLAAKIDSLHYAAHAIPGRVEGLPRTGLPVRLDADHILGRTPVDQR